jgi:hypothetical protein
MAKRQTGTGIPLRGGKLTPAQLNGPPRPPGGGAGLGATQLGVNPIFAAGLNNTRLGTNAAAAPPAFVSANTTIVYDPLVHATLMQLVTLQKPGAVGAAGAANQGVAGQREGQRGGFLGTAANVASTFGLPGAGLLGALATGGPLGIAGAAVGMFTSTIQKATSAAGNFAVAALSFNGSQIARSIFDLAGNIPVVGGIISGFGNAVLGAGDAMRGLAERLSAYNPGLAVTLAMQEVRQVFRDMERANRLGPDLARAVETRRQFEEKLEDLILQYAPQIIQMLELIFKALGAAVDSVGEAFNRMESVRRIFQNAVAPGFSNITSATDSIRQVLGRMGQRLEDDSMVDQVEQWTQFLLGDLSAAVAAGGAATAGQAAVGPNFPVFGG